MAHLGIFSVVIGGATVVVLAAMLALVAVRPGETRAALVAGLLPLAVAPLLLAVALAGWNTSERFARLAQDGSTGGAEQMESLVTQQWLLVRVGAGASALLAAVGLSSGLLRFGRRAADARRLSVARAAVLVLLPLLALCTAALLARELRTGLGVVRAVMTPVDDHPERKAAVQAHLDGLGLGGPGIMQIVERLSASLVIAMSGMTVAPFVILGLATTGSILAWRVRVGWTFVALAAVLWLALLVPGVLLAADVPGLPSF